MQSRIEHDSMGEIKVPSDALYGAQTQRAIENFKISSLKMPSHFIHALALIKAGCAYANGRLHLLSEDKAKAIEKAALQVVEGKYDPHFPLDIFQTGSGTSTNMNANEVIAQIVLRDEKLNVHPNDDVNMSQSSNDVIPSSIHLSSYLLLKHKLIPSLQHLQDSILKKAFKHQNVVKTGRTHLMDALPITLSQEMSAWASQLKNHSQYFDLLLPSLSQLAVGGTAIGTGVNAHPDFANYVVDYLNKHTGEKFRQGDNLFALISSQDTAVALSGQLKALSVSLIKIANDLRWMNSGPLTGLGEIALSSLQPGSSIMPGKVNPVVPESLLMICAQVIGNDASITLGGLSGNFQLNVMLPLIAHNLLQSIHILSEGMQLLADKGIQEFKVNQLHLETQLAKNPILVTALNSVIGYELGAKIAKTAYEKGLPLLEVAKEMTDLSEEKLKELLNPINLTKGGLPK